MGKREILGKKGRKFFTLLTLFFASAMISLSFFSYFFQTPEVNIQKKKDIENEYIALEKIKEKEEEILKSILSEVEDYKQNTSSSSSSVTKVKKNPPKPSINKKIVTQKKESHIKSPKLVIIIDDVAFSYQIRAIKSLYMPITLSFFPPSKRYPNTSYYAKRLKHYMVHLPMEANSYQREEKETLKVGDNIQKIENVIKGIREKFPNAKFINNHTGSRFTSDFYSMNEAFKIFQKYGFIFVDSRTTAKTQAPKISKIYNLPYIHRDVFLDNELDISKIKEQLKKAVKIAKKRGYAIAIGHPHKHTIEALRASKDILKEVKLVYIDELF